MIKKSIYAVSLMVFVLLISVYVIINTEGDVVGVENKATITTVKSVDVSPKYVSGISSLVTPEQISVLTKADKRESCVITNTTTMMTISTSSSPETGDVAVVLHNNGIESRPTTAVLHRGTSLVDFLSVNNPKNIVDPKVIIGTVESYVDSELSVVLSDNTTKKIDTSGLSLFILNAAGLPNTIRFVDRVDMNCEYNKGVWEAKSVTVFN